MPGDPILKKVSDAGQTRTRTDVHVLPAADLRALPESVVCGVLPVGCDVQARPRTASCWSTRTAAAAGGCACPDARTRRCISTTRPARPRSARSAIRASRSGCRRCARRPASGGCATSAWCSTTSTGCSRRPRSRTTKTCTRRNSTSCSTRTIPEVIAGARAEGISDEWIEAAQRSPVYALIKDYRVALPLHPEFRTMPMVWYVPPLSPVVDAVSRDGHDGEDSATCSALSTRCAFRSSTWPDCSPRATPPSSRACCDGWRPCGRTCATSTSAANRSRDIPAAVGMSEE